MGKPMIGLNTWLVTIGSCKNFKQPGLPNSSDFFLACHLVYFLLMMILCVHVFIYVHLCTVYMLIGPVI